MICKTKRLRGTTAVTRFNGTFTAPAVLYRSSDGGITDEPNGALLAFLNAESGDKLAEGPVYLAPCGALTDEPNGNHIFSLFDGDLVSIWNIDGTINDKGTVPCNDVIPCGD